MTMITHDREDQYDGENTIRDAAFWADGEFSP